MLPQLGLEPQTSIVRIRVATQELHILGVHLPRKIRRRVREGKDGKGVSRIDKEKTHKVHILGVLTCH